MNCGLLSIECTELLLSANLAVDLNLILHFFPKCSHDLREIKGAGGGRVEGVGSWGMIAI